MECGFAAYQYWHHAVPGHVWAFQVFWDCIKDVLKACLWRLENVMVLFQMWLYVFNVDRVYNCSLVATRLVLVIKCATWCSTVLSVLFHKQRKTYSSEETFQVVFDSFLVIVAQIHAAFHYIVAFLRVLNWNLSSCTRNAKQEALSCFMPSLVFYFRIKYVLIKCKHLRC